MKIRVLDLIYGEKFLILFFGFFQRVKKTVAKKRSKNKIFKLFIEFAYNFRN